MRYKKTVLCISVLGIISLSFLIPSNVYAASLSANTKNAPVGADIFDLNNTSTTRYVHVSNQGKFFATQNADFHNSTSVFDSSQFCLRNPASTFTTCLANSAVAANRTLTWPLLTGSDTVATLGLAQTFSGALTSTGGITMSGSNLAMGTNTISGNFIMSGSPEITFADGGSNTMLTMLTPSMSNGHNSLVFIGDSLSASKSYAFGYVAGATSYFGIVPYGTTIGSGGLSIDQNNNVNIFAGKKLCLDGSGGLCGNNYIVESSANVNDFYAGGVRAFQVNSNNVETFLPLILPAATGSGSVYGIDSSSTGTITVNNGTTATPFGSGQEPIGLIEVWDSSSGDNGLIWANGLSAPQILANTNNKWSTTQNHASTYNIYLNGGTITFQNNIGFSTTMRFLAFKVD